MRLKNWTTDNTAKFGLATLSMTDGWRILCALIVVALHTQSIGGWLKGFENLYMLAHHAVIIFFVISGYCIAASTDKTTEKDKLTPHLFLAKRLARVYSVALPALVVAVILDFSSDYRNSNLYPTWQYAKWYLHFAFNAVFLGELWNQYLRPFSIIPWWSLAYEVWYYLLFAALLHPTKSWRYALCSLILLCMGPRLWLLLPCWWLGVLAYHASQLPAAQLCRLGPWTASIGFAILYLIALAFGLRSFHDVASLAVVSASKALFFDGLRMEYSRWFISDTLVALAFALALLSSARGAINSNSSWHKTLRWLAPFTFGIYLFHYTLLAFFESHWPQRMSSNSAGLIAIVGVVLLSSALTYFAMKCRPFIETVLHRLILRPRKSPNADKRPRL